MKEWQKGYHLEYLEEIVERFEDFNELSCSPFSEMSKNKVAEALEKGNIEILSGSNGHSHAIIESHVNRNRGEITADGNVVIGIKEDGDRIVTKISGDVILIPTPGAISRGKTGTTHGSAYSYDTHVPIIFYGAGIKNGFSHKDYNVRDIAPTLATLLGVEFPNGNSGKVIEEVLE